MNIVLVEPEIPPNTGNVARLCAATHTTLHLVEPLGFALNDAQLKRAGMDYWTHLDLHLHDNWDAYLETVRPTRLFFASTRGSRSLYDCTFAAGDVLVFGNESSGLPEEFYARYQEDLFRIPMPGPHARSLNLANAVSVAAYEALRQLATRGQVLGVR